MHFHRIGSWLLLLAGGVPALAGTQTLPPQAVEQINAATKARVRLVGGDRGILHRPRADSISLGYQRGEFLSPGGRWVQRAAPLQLAQIAQIEVASGSHAGAGAKIGGAIGVGLGIVLFVAANAEDPGYFSTGDAITGTLITGVVGAALGALIGSGSPRWGTVYPLPAP